MTPPRPARLLARLAAAREDREFVLRDLDERFASIAAERGSRAAARWYWSQVLRGILFRARPDLSLVHPSGWRGGLGELRIGVRSLARRPMYTFGVAGTLALGLGTAALVWAVAYRVWLAPLPFPDPDRVVRLFETEPPEMADAAEGRAEARRWRVSPPMLERMRANQWATLDGVAGVSPDEFDWAVGAEVRRLSVLMLSPEAFGILGISPTVGGLLADDRPPEVLLTEDFWIREFGADPGVVGRETLLLDQRPHAVVGVVRLPEGYPGTAELVSPLAFGPDQLSQGMRGARYLDVIARVRPGRSIEEAIAEAGAFVSGVGREEGIYLDWAADAMPLQESLTEPYRAVLALLLAAGVSFLLLAVVNVSGLVAARRAEAVDDRAVRLALGASESRLLRASVVESAVLALGGAALAFLGARLLLEPMRALVPQDVPRLSEVSVDGVLGLAVVAGGITVGLVVGVAGYLMSRGASSPSRGRRTVTAPGLRGRQLLVGGQVALTTVLTTGGVAILLRASELRSIDLGFEPETVWSANTLLSEVRYPDHQARLALWRGLEEGLRARGIEAAVAVNAPMSGMNAPYGFFVDADADQRFAQYHAVGDAYFEVMGIEVLEGRGFGRDDDEGSPPVVIVDRTFAEEHLPPGEVVGTEIRVLSTRRTIVGVVEGTRHFGPDADAPPSMYVPLAQDPWQTAAVLVRTARIDADDVLQEVAAATDPYLGLPPLRPYRRHVSEWYAPLRLQLVMVGGLALLGLLLASLGLYAVVAYHVSTRRREIGIRMALGAPVATVVRAVVAQGIRLGVFGSAVGLVAWYLLSPKVEAIAEGVGGGGPGGAALVLAIVGGACVVATLVPAWRSAAVDPASTLQAD